MPDHNPLLRIALDANCDPESQDFFLLRGFSLAVFILTVFLAVYG